MMIINAALGLVVLAALPIRALDAAGWKRQSIYQVLTDRFNRDDGDMTPCDLALKDYCGGTWRGIIEKLDYIQDMGFTAIWISPVIENLERGYHGYFGLNPYKLNPHFGTSQDLKDLSSALHARDMYLMVDVAPNHLGSHHIFSEFTPSSIYGPYDKAEHFHPPCFIQDWDNQTQVEDCWLGPFGDVSLADLDTRHPDVVREMNEWVKWLVGEFEIDGLRLDTVKHVNKDFWHGFIEAAGVFCIGEVYHGNPDYVVGYQWDAMESLFNFPTYYPLTRAFESITGDMFELTNMILTMQSKAKDITLLSTFTDNHDVKRFSHYTPDPSLRQNAYAFPLLADGFPVTYSGSEHALEGHDDPFNREPTWLYGLNDQLPQYQLFKRLNWARHLALAVDSDFTEKLAVPLVTTEHELVLRRGPLISVFSNRGAHSHMSLVYVQIDGLKTGSYLVDLLSDDDAAATMVGHGGNVRFEIYDGRPRVFVQAEVLDRFRASDTSEAAAAKVAQDEPTATGSANIASQTVATWESTPAQSRVGRASSQQALSRNATYRTARERFAHAASPHAHYPIGAVAALSWQALTLGLGASEKSYAD